MNDAEKMFYNEVAERKRLARNARYKKNGSHSKKFGGVRYSQKDLERKNGEVVSYKMNVPHTIEELDAWPLDIQAEYYQSLTDSYFPQRLVCEMLGTSTRTLAKRLRACGVNWHGGNFKESRWLSAWNDFIIRGVAPEEVQEEVEAIEESVEFGNDGIDVSAAESNEVIALPQVEQRVSSVTNLSVTACGRPEDVMAAVLKLLGDGNYRVTLTVEAID